MSNILVTGSSGFLGTAAVRALSASGRFNQIRTFRSSEYDLRDRTAIQQLFADNPVDTVLHLAAVVGGIGANQAYPGKLCYENLIMGAELIEQARVHGVKKFVLISTICAYPKFCPVPFQETNLWNGYPEETNAPYGIAKKAISVQLDAYRRQYGLNGITLLMVNLYGPNDNFDLGSSHVIPAMLRRFHEAALAGNKSVTLWGDGSASREFLYVDDAGEAITLATANYNKAEPVNIGSGQEISIKDLAQMVREITGFRGEIKWDTSRPNGQPRRCLDVTRATKEFGFAARTALPDGLEKTYQWFRNQYDTALARGDRLAQELAH
jgi:GDP-L-fucose synthase